MNRARIRRVVMAALVIVLALASARTRAADDGAQAGFTTLKPPAPVIKLRPATLYDPASGAGILDLL